MSNAKSSFHTFIKDLQIKLSNKNLPGEKAHNELFPESRRNFPEGNNSKAIPSAVLILIYPDKNNQPTTVFIKRNSYHGHHSRQISFPGGKSENSDNDLVDTALRETFEEIGVSCKKENILGKLSELYITVSNFIVYPYVGYLESTPVFIPDKQEVEQLIEINTIELLSLSILSTNLEIKNSIVKVPYFPLKKEILWGATAMIVNELKHIV